MEIAHARRGSFRRRATSPMPPAIASLHRCATGFRSSQISAQRRKTPERRQCAACRRIRTRASEPATRSRTLVDVRSAGAVRPARYRSIDPANPRPPQQCRPPLARRSFEQFHHRATFPTSPDASLPAGSVDRCSAISCAPDVAGSAPRPGNDPIHASRCALNQNAVALRFCSCRNLKPAMAPSTPALTRRLPQGAWSRSVLHSTQTPPRPQIKLLKSKD